MARGIRGFCGARVDPACLQIAANDAVFVSLSFAPESWFRALPRLGETLHLARNPLAVMGRLGPVPSMASWACPVLPRDAAGDYAPNLAEYGSIWAVREPSPQGIAYGFEVRDLAGEAGERFLLSAPGGNALYEGMVLASQSPPQPLDWFPPNHAWSAWRRAKTASRGAWLRAQWSQGNSSVRCLPADFPRRLLAAAAQADCQIRTLHYSSLAMRGATWTPATSASNVAEGFFAGDATALRLQAAGAATVWLWMGACGCCRKSQWSMEIAGADGRIGLAVMAGGEEWEAPWRALIQACWP